MGNSASNITTRESEQYHTEDATSDGEEDLHGPCGESEEGADPDVNHGNPAYGPFALPADTAGSESTSSRDSRVRAQETFGDSELCTNSSDNMPIGEAVSQHQDASRVTDVATPIAGQSILEVEETNESNIEWQDDDGSASGEGSSTGVARDVSGRGDSLAQSDPATSGGTATDGLGRGVVVGEVMQSLMQQVLTQSVDAAGADTEPGAEDQAQTDIAQSVDAQQQADEDQPVVAEDQPVVADAEPQTATAQSNDAESNDAEPTANAHPPFTLPEIHRMTVATLRIELALRKQDTRGLKAILRNRLAAACGIDANAAAVAADAAAARRAATHDPTTGKHYAEWFHTQVPLSNKLSPWCGRMGPTQVWTDDEGVVTFDEYKHWTTEATKDDMLSPGRYFKQYFTNEIYDELLRESNKQPHYYRGRDKPPYIPASNPWPPKWTEKWKK